MRRVLSLLAGTLMLAGCGDGQDPSSLDAAAERLSATEASAAHHAGFGPAASATYSFTITNLTGGQPFTPPLAVTHRRPVSMFTVGEPASAGLQQIAENGNLTPMKMWLEGSRHVTDLAVAAGDPPPLFPGQTVTFELGVDRGAKYLSFVSMLICTNDGFTGVEGLRLPDRPGESITTYAGAYDAGTEINTEDFADLVPPCPALTGVSSDDDGTGQSDPSLAENGVVRSHPGVAGDDDLSPSIHGWTDPVAMIEVERVN